MLYKVKSINCTTYYKDSKLKIIHREDGPAVEWQDGSMEWYINGFIHREDGPAIETSQAKAWYKNGKLHREGGPAVEYTDGEKYYFLNDKVYSEEDYWAIIRFGAFA